MSYGSEQTRKRILAAAKEEFLAEGFQNASLRRIAEKANGSTGAIYMHFKSKEGLFAHLVSDVYNSMAGDGDATEAATEFKINLADYTQKTQAAMMFVKYMLENRDVFELLLCHSGGTSFECFIDDVAKSYARQSMLMIQEQKKFGLVRNVPPEHHVYSLCRSYFYLLFDIISSKMPEEQIEGYVKNIIAFEHYGWHGLLGVTENSHE